MQITNRVSRSCFISFAMITVSGFTLHAAQKAAKLTEAQAVISLINRAADNPNANFKREWSILWQFGSSTQEQRLLRVHSPVALKGFEPLKKDDPIIVYQTAAKDRKAYIIPSASEKKFLRLLLVKGKAKSTFLSSVIQVNTEKIFDPLSVPEQLLSAINTTPAFPPIISNPVQVLPASEETKRVHRSAPKYGQSLTIPNVKKPVTRS